MFSSSNYTGELGPALVNRREMLGPVVIVQL